MVLVFKWNGFLTDLSLSKKNLDISYLGNWLPINGLKLNALHFMSHIDLVSNVLDSSGVEQLYKRLLKFQFSPNRRAVINSKSPVHGLLYLADWIIFHWKCRHQGTISINWILTYLCRDKMAAVFQTAFSNAFSWMKMHEFRFILNWSLFLWVTLLLFQH